MRIPKIYRRPALAATVLCALAGLGVASALAQPAHPASTTPLVALKNIAFHPPVVHIKKGQSVTWKWEDADIDTQHNVTSIGATRFKSSSTKMSGTYTIKFTHTGTYKFECTIHPQSMQGKVIVS